MQSGISFYYVSRLGRRADDPVYIIHKDHQDNTVGRVRVAGTQVDLLDSPNDASTSLEPSLLQRRFGNVIDILRRFDHLPDDNSDLIDS